MYVSNISYINNNNNEYYVLNRDNGQPLAGAKAQLWQRIYDYKKNAYDESKKELYSTDKNGYFKLIKHFYCRHSKTLDGGFAFQQPIRLAL